MNKHHVSKKEIRFEVTESAFSESSKTVVQVLNRLNELGYMIEIDDFGSGYSSLNTLKDCNAKILKLDMRFFEKTTNSRKSGNIIESVIRMARWLGMQVIAEGVENKVDADYLKTIGCTFIQGYLYFPPLSLKNYESIINQSAIGKLEPELRTIENLNNNAFWNPKSIETLIFNSLVGGACIFEFHDKKIEILRVNEQFGKELGNLESDESTYLSMDVLSILDSKNQEKFLNTLNKSIETKKEVQVELELLGREGEESEFILLHARLIARNDDYYLFYSLISNETQDIRALERQRIAEKKEYESAKMLKMGVVY